MAARGVNIWFDLMTTDVDGAKRFYGEVIGWNAKLWEDSDPGDPYTMWLAGEQPIGGVLRQMGTPPHWMAYTSVDDVDATVAQVEKLGGRVYRPAADIAKVGRFAVLGDPQGAVFAVFEPVGEMPAPSSEEPMRFSWAELNTTDYESAWTFYSQLFGWKERSRMDMGPAGTYFMFQSEDGATKGGMSNMAKQMNVPPHWLHYVTVSDMDATTERIRKNGGKVMNGPMSIPGDDVIAQCADPQGAFFAVYASGR